MSNEADTCRQFVVPRLQAASWDTDPHSIAEQRYTEKFGGAEQLRDPVNQLQGMLYAG